MGRAEYCGALCRDAVQFAVPVTQYDPHLTAWRTSKAMSTVELAERVFAAMERDR
jgi:hypothetical protein